MSYLKNETQETRKEFELMKYLISENDCIESYEFGIGSRFEINYKDFSVVLLSDGTWFLDKDDEDDNE